MASNTKLSFSFGGMKAPGAPSAPAAPKSNLEALMAKAKPAKKASLFDDEDEDDSHSAPPPSLAGPSRPKSTTKTPTGNPALPRASRKAQEEALALDASVFDYDGVYDQLKARERAKELAKKAEADDRKPKYMENFLASAQTRKLDKLRAEEKMLAHEREKEGGLYEDKEKFVTEGYKRQMEEVKKAEEEERKREEAIRKSGKGPGLTAFYKTMLDSSSAAHDAVVDANPSAGPSLAIKPPTSYEPEAEYDPFLAREAAASGSAPSPLKKAATAPDGKDVEINDEGEVVDKRELLRAGLNITKKPKVELPDSLGRGGKGGAGESGAYQSKAVGTAAGYQERMRRERERLAQQLKEETERKRAEVERRAKEEEDAARRRREGDDGEAEKRREEARERFRERKRKMEEEAKGKAGKGDKGDEEAKKAKH